MSISISDGSCPLPALADHLDRRLAELSRLLRNDAQSGCTLAALLTLRRLADGGPQRVTDLAAAERVSQPTMTGLLNRLECDGLVVRATDPDDARAVRVAITAAGTEHVEGARRRRAEALERRLRTLDPAHRRLIENALPAIEALLEGERGGNRT